MSATEMPPIERAWSRRLLGATLYGATVATLIGTSVLTHFYHFDGEHIGVGRAFVWQAGIYFSWAALVPVIVWLAEAPHTPKARRLRLTLGGLLLVPLHSLFTVWLGWLMRPWPNGRPSFGTPGYAFHNSLAERLPIDLLIYLGIVAALIAMGYAAEARLRGVRAAETETLLARARFDALSSRLQPHFLFNALQAIATLIKRDPESATRMTVRLGDLLRASLNRSGEQEVPLGDELALLRAYLDIEAVRFADRLRIEYDVDAAAAECLVPDLLLQPLVENAVRHGIAPMAEGGTIRVVARREGGRLVVVVEDDGAGLGSVPANRSEGVGLTVTRERLAHLYGAAARIELASGANGRGTVARIELPARTTARDSTASP